MDGFEVLNVLRWVLFIPCLVYPCSISALRASCFLGTQKALKLGKLRTSKDCCWWRAQESSREPDGAWRVSGYSNHNFSPFDVCLLFRDWIANCQEFLILGMVSQPMRVPWAVNNSSESLWKKEIFKFVARQTNRLSYWYCKWHWWLKKCLSFFFCIYVCIYLMLLKTFKHWIRHHVWKCLLKGLSQS